MKPIESFAKPSYPVRIVQFGEGNFLRAFIEPMVDTANEQGRFGGSVAVVKPTSRGDLARFERQNCLYTVLLRGLQNGKPTQQSRLIRCIDRAFDPARDEEAFQKLAEEPALQYCISNTTEAGIRFDADDSMSHTPVSFPGKVTKLLFLRYRAFGGDPAKGLIFLPCELIEQNGRELLQTVLQTAHLWQLPPAFCEWVENCNTFCNTLVDRIVTGFPEQEKEALWQKLGYRDDLLTVGEPFALWAVQGVGALPFADQNTVFVPDLAPVRKQKVRLLNGAHTSGVPVAFLAGKTIVRDSVLDPLTGAFFRQTVEEEILPALPGAEAFAQSVFERFANPYIDHALLAILLNSVSKWRVRVLPSVKDHYLRTGALPKRLVFSFAALLRLYTVAGRDENGFFGKKDDGTVYPLRDDERVLLAFSAACNEPDYVLRIARDASLWGEDLSALPGFADLAGQYLSALQTDVITAIREVLA